MNRHQFQSVARQFRAGKLSIAEFTDLVIPVITVRSGSIDSGKLDALPRLPMRNIDSHKGHYGHVMVLAGSRGMAGAAALTAIAALRCGAGLVTVATARSVQDVVSGFHPAIMTIGLNEDTHGRISVESWKELSRKIPKADCLALGPGMGTSPELRNLVRDIFEIAPMPCVVDADGLNNLGHEVTRPKMACLRLLTPHPGELNRLIGETLNARDQQESAAIALAARLGSVVILKGHGSLVTDGHQSRRNGTGNPGMATAGSGDVLTGITAALIGQGLVPWDAAVLGCHVHGLAGDRAAGQFGLHAMIATDIIESIPFALQSSNTPNSLTH